ncbi:Transposon Ty3-G Gag-Pol polyprotein [Trichinella britovi]|uniref:Transposon Ty3-G Gag-Pol polyprotein n=1 Tax=Trichinella britovi TaxID=45882 RepID=A0A0V1C8L4_TRIBR|nr:Transposon Ty3-G Gag-Pol polyprotein [Trichinella britovi]
MNEPCKAPHRDRRGPAGEAAIPPPSPSPAGGGGQANRGGNRTSLRPLEFTSSAGSKKDGSPRFCVDYRRLNAVTRVDAQPIPRIDDTLDALAGAKWYSTLDLASGYWQVEVAERDREKTALSTPLGLFQFRVMPFGLCNALATFQRLMQKALRRLKWKTCLVYLDDIIVFGKTEEAHLERLEGVLSRLQSVGLKIKSKCQLMRQLTLPGPHRDAAWGWYRSREDGGGPGVAHASVRERSPAVPGTGDLSGISPAWQIRCTP